MCTVLLTTIHIATADAGKSKRPHLIYILADDFGWADADWHRPDSFNETATPALRKLMETEGIELDHHYAYKFCSPSRSAIQSGRNPIHVNVQNYQPLVYNPKNENVNTRFAGVPVNMTILPEMIKRGDGNYSAHFVGKWDCGMATDMHLPVSRGYDTSLHYFHHDNDYWTSRTRATDTLKICPKADDLLVDLWSNKEPAHDLVNPKSCALDRSSRLPYPTLSDGTTPDPACTFEDRVFLDRVVDIINDHDIDRPLFLFWSAHTVHGPLQVPKEFYVLYEHVPDERRRRYLAMVRWLDTAVSNVTQLLKTRGMYDDALIVFTSDNGGPIYFGGSGGANNYPLKGGKTSNWQGGIRVNAFVYGGLIPEAMRGRKLDGLGAVWDWYATFARLAGVVDTVDREAATTGLPPIDSVDLWDYLSGAVGVSPRQRLPIGSTSCVNASLPGCLNKWGWGDVHTVVSGLIEDRRHSDGGLWKLVLDANPMSGWTGVYYPNASTPSNAFAFNSVEGCGSLGCLFRLDEDPSEHIDVSSMNETIAREMISLVRSLNTTTFSPDRGPGESQVSIADAACDAALRDHNGVFGPFI